jgi:hypothetical protein
MTDLETHSFTDTADELGKCAAAIAAGVDPSYADANFAVAESEHRIAPLLITLKLATQMLDEVGLDSTVYKTAAITGETDWSPLHDDLAATFVDVLERHEKQKKAGAVLNTIGKGLGFVGGLSKEVLAAAVAGGGSLGALYWWLNRNELSDDAEANKMIELKNYYKDVGEDLKEQTDPTSKTIETGNVSSFEAARKALDTQ